MDEGVNLAELLPGTRVERVDAPLDDLFALSLRSRDARGVLLLGLSPRARGVGWTAQRPRGAPARGVVSALRKHVEGARVTALEQPQPGVIVLRLRRAERDASLVAQLFGRGNLLLLDAERRVVLALHRAAPDEDPCEAPPGAREVALEATEQEFAHRADALCTRLATAAESEARARLLKSVRDRQRKLERRLQAIEGDRERAAAVETLRRDAGLVLSHLHELPDGCEQVELLDASVDPPRPITLVFDRALGPRRQAEAWFDRARKLERGARVAADRAAATRRELDTLAELQQTVQMAQGEQALVEIAARARELGAAPQPPPRERRTVVRIPYREFRGSGQRPILVGRGPADNDRLTLSKARPQDLWLHARDHGGAHVVVPLQRDEACPPELLCDAATLAAHFSQARGQRDVDVIYTHRRYVRKPRKTPAGRVLVEREKVFRLRLEEGRLSRLLRNELARQQ